MRFDNLSSPLPMFIYVAIGRGLVRKCTCFYCLCPSIKQKNRPQRRFFYLRGLADDFRLIKKGLTFQSVPLDYSGFIAASRSPIFMTPSLYVRRTGDKCWEYHGEHSSLCAWPVIPPRLSAGVISIDIASRGASRGGARRQTPLGGV